MLDVALLCIVALSSVKDLEERHSLRAQRKAILDELWDEFQRVSLFALVSMQRLQSLISTGDKAVQRVNRGEETAIRGTEKERRKQFT